MIVPQRGPAWWYLLEDAPERPAWRVLRSSDPVTCRSCGSEFTRGWHWSGPGRIPSEPYLCGRCWTLGVGIEL